MKAVILVGGEGTRLRPLTCNTPKPMLPLINRPLLEHVVTYLRGHGIDDIILSMCYRPDVIKEHFGDGTSLGARLTYEVETEPLGTAGGVKNVERHLDDTFFVFNGDILTDLDLGAMLEFHRSRGSKATISLTPVEDPTAYGLVETTTDGRVKQFVEKPSWDRVTTNMINAGTYVLEPDVLQHIPPNAYHMFERGLFPFLLQRGDPLYGYPSNAYWLDIGTPQKYLTAHHDALTAKVAVAMSGTRARESVWLGEGCMIDPSARLVPPIVLGRHVRVQAKATLVGPLSVDDECTIGREALLEGAVVWRRTTIGDGSKLKNCLIGTDCLIAEGVTLSGGAVIADGVTIGTGNRLEHGIRVWPGKNIEPNAITF
jgi:mannose-1-phosphate guanylyltransferase